MKRLLLISTCLFITVPAFAQQAGMQSPAYRECSALANSNPTQALAKADAWLKFDAGVAAQHCRAMALYGLRRFAESADALSAVRGMIAPENITLRSYVSRQASNAFVGANKADQAIGLLTTQINEISTIRTDNGIAAGVTSELLVERARIHTNFGKLDDAAKDLDHAVSLTPVNESVLMERAGVFEKLGDLSLAKNDLNSILVINSSNSAARAAMTRLGGGIPASTLSHAAPHSSHSTYAPSSPFASAPQAEQPVAKPPVKRAKKKKRLKKPVVKPQEDLVIEMPENEASAILGSAAEPATPAAAAVPVSSATPPAIPTPKPALPPAGAAPATSALPALPPAGAAPATSALPALPPAGAAPATSALPALPPAGAAPAGMPGLPPLPMPKP